MGYSRIYKEDVFQHLLEMPNREDDSDFRQITGGDFELGDIQELEDMLCGVLPGLESIECSGTFFTGVKHDEPVFGIRPEIIQDIFDMMSTLQCEPYTGLCTFTSDSLRRSRNWCSSYYLKHVFEWVRKQRGIDTYYVSNGECIMGYTLYTLYGLGENLLKSLVRRDADSPRWLNVDFRMPGVFSIIEGYYARRIEDGRL